VLGFGDHHWRRARPGGGLARDCVRAGGGGRLGPSVLPADLAEIARTWLLEMQACVRAVDYERARPLFAEDVVAFGTFAAVVSGRDRLEQAQWRRVWPTIDGFTFRLDQLHCLGTDQALCLVVPWDSLGRRERGERFPRPGRATLLLAPRGERWVAVHSHFSLAPSPAAPGG
jgi:ketosteroid isomerase-like protein